MSGTICRLPFPQPCCVYVSSETWHPSLVMLVSHLSVSDKCETSHYEARIACGGRLRRVDANRASVCPVPETQKPSAPVTITHKTAWGSDEVSQTTAFCGVGKLAFFHKRRREEVFTQAQSRKEQSFLFQSIVSHDFRPDDPESVPSPPLES